LIDITWFEGKFIYIGEFIGDFILNSRPLRRGIFSCGLTLPEQREGSPQGVAADKKGS